MNTPMIQEDAFEDFFSWIKSQPFWRDIPRTEKQYIYKARQAQRDGTLGEVRATRLFNKYAPGRYITELNFIRLK